MASINYPLLNKWVMIPTELKDPVCTTEYNRSSFHLAEKLKKEPKTNSTLQSVYMQFQKRHIS